MRTVIASLIIALCCALGVVAGRAQANPPSDTGVKVFVCKYVGQPGVDETLQTGQNPIDVSVNAIPDYQGVGSYFADAQGRSFVLGPEHQANEQVETPDVSLCPDGDTPVLDCSGDQDETNNGPFGNCDEGVQVCVNGEIVLAPTGTEDDGTCEEEPPCEETLAGQMLGCDEEPCPPGTHIFPSNPATDQRCVPNDNPPDNNPNHPNHHTPDNPPILTGGTVPITR